MSLDFESKIGNISPHFVNKFGSLVKSLAQFGGGAETARYTSGKFFSSAYELYIYSFFLGLTGNRTYEIIPDEEKSRFMEIKYWKPVELRDQLIACAIGESQVDLFQLQFAEEEGQVQQMVREVRHTIEAYANGGLELIAEKFEESPDAKHDDEFLLKLMLSIKEIE
ncbi:hypothetical protein OAO10_00130 [Luminiphilus sp.]|nr:hypothetical protein [Luminiphilus sp.]